MEIQEAFKVLLNRDMNDVEDDAAADAALQVENDYALNLGGFPVFSCESATAYVETLEQCGRVPQGRYDSVGQCVAFALAHSALFLARLRTEGPVRPDTSIAALGQALAELDLTVQRVYTQRFGGTSLTVVVLRRGDHAEEGVGATLSDAFALAMRVFMVHMPRPA